jgi:hypothetical protein
MATQVRKASYCYVLVPHRAGQGAAVLAAVAEAGVNLLAFSAFPTGGGKAQVDLVAESVGPIRRALMRRGLRVTGPKRCFVIQGDDRVGAVHRQLARLAKAGINATAVDAAAAGRNRYGMLLWVKPKDYARAARALGAR